MNNEFAGLTQDEMRRDILTELCGTGPVPQETNPVDKKAQAEADAKDRAEDTKIGFFLKNAGTSAIDADTRAAVMKQIQAALKTL